MAKPRNLQQIHPLVVRVTHWVNALAMVAMIMSGWRIYDASPVFNFMIPARLTLGGWLGGALLWHFAAMWVLVANGLLYMAYGLLSGHFRRKLLPVRLGGIWRDFLAALRFRLAHRVGIYNQVQRLLYLCVLLLSIGVVVSGLSIWKPVQFRPVTYLLGGYDDARIVHFVMMAGIVGFVAVHVLLVMLVPKTLTSMIVGRRVDMLESAS